MEQLSIKNILLGLCIVLALLLFGWICPFQHFCGLPCPGCMMTTALYYVIQLDFSTAYFFNPAVYVLLTGCILAQIFRRNKKIQKMILWSMLGIWLMIYAVRMITVYPNYPMHYVEDNIISKIFSFFIK